jgi:curli production assembly/transport component CsgG
MEGLIDSLWSVNESNQAALAEVITDYKKEKEEMRQTDVFGASPFRIRKNAALYANGCAYRYEGDYPNPLIKYGYELGLEQTINDKWSVGLAFGMGELQSERDFQLKFSHGDLYFKYRFLPSNRFSPLVAFGSGMLFNEFFKDQDNIKLFGGVGFEYLFTKNLGLNVLFDNNYLINDRLDGMEYGKYNDYYWRSRLGLIVHFGGKKSG